MPGIFLGLEFQSCVFFWVCNMKLRRTPRHVYYTSSTSPGVVVVALPKLIGRIYGPCIQGD